MAKRTGRKVNRTKAIPIYFQKSQASVSQILIASNYKQRIKELMKNNKELACSLQDVKYRVADQERSLAEYNRQSTKMKYIKTKMKDMVTTVQKLVTDLDEVSNYIDGKTCDFLKSCSMSHDDVRLKIPVPNITTIEESASTSTIEADLSKEEKINCGNVITSVGIESKLKTYTSPRRENSTEASQSPLLLSTEADLQDYSNQNQNARPRVSKSPECSDSLSVDISRTPQGPVIPPNFQLKSPAASQNFLHFKFQPRNIPFSSTVKKLPHVTASKIPKRTLTSPYTNHPLSTFPLNHFTRRETFVIKGIDTVLQIPASSTDRRATFVLNLAGDNHLSERRATYLIPVQPEEPIPSPPKIIETNPEIIVSNKTVILCQDMELGSKKEIQKPAEQLSENYHNLNDKELHCKKKYSEGRCSLLKANGVVLKNADIKIKTSSSNKQSSCSLSSDSLESNLENIEIPNKKNSKLSQKLKKSNKDIEQSEENRIHSGNLENLNSKQSTEKEEVITQKDTSEIVSKTEPNLDANDKINKSPNENDIKIKNTKEKRTFSGVSNRSSKKRSTLDDDFLSDLDNAMFSRGTLSKETEKAGNFVTEDPTEIYNINGLVKPTDVETSENNKPVGEDAPQNTVFSCGTLSKETEMANNFVTEEPMEIYNINDLKKVKTSQVKTSKKDNPIGKKAPRIPDISSKKDNLNTINVLGEIQPDNFSDLTKNKKVLTLANKKCNPKMPHNKILKLDILTSNNDIELRNFKNLPLTENNADVKCSILEGKKVEKSKLKKSCKKISNENDDPNSLDVRNVKSDVGSKRLSVDLEPLPLLQNHCASDVPCATSPMATLGDAEVRRPRRARPVKNLKEPKMNTKMRR